MKTFVTCAALLCTTTPVAFAQVLPAPSEESAPDLGLYAGAGTSSFGFQGISLSATTVYAGYDVTKYFSFEAEYSTGRGERRETYDSYLFDYWANFADWQLDSQYAAYAVARLGSDDGWNAFARLGYGQVKLDAEVDHFVPSFAPSDQRFVFDESVSTDGVFLGLGGAMPLASGFSAGGSYTKFMGEDAEVMQDGADILSLFIAYDF